MDIKLTSELVNASFALNNSSTLFMALFVFSLVVIGILKHR